MSSFLNSRTQQLETALSQGLLPHGMAALGEQLLNGLRRPTRITAFGMPGAGKTSILNMVLGTNAMPDLKEISAVELAWGEEAKGYFESRTGEETTFVGMVQQDQIPDDTLRVVQHVPLASVRGKHLIEINFTKLLGASSDIIDWATQDADIAIWCSRAFNETEHAIWSQVPDRLKDNGFLALTHADRLLMQGTLDAHVAQFEADFADEFAGLYPVATLQAVAACIDGEIVEPGLWKASGCKALSDAITRVIEQGKQADADHAEVLLTRANLDMTPAQDISEASPENPTVHDPMGHSEALDNALSILEQSADALKPANNTEMPKDDVLELCGQTAQALAALFMDAEPENSMIAAISDDVIETEQKIQLLRVERTEKAAADAIAVLLQLKKEMAEAAQ